MNTKLSIKQMNDHSQSETSQTVSESRFQWPSLSSMLRVAGALLVTASGVIYLLQGLAEANIALRYWAYLALMLILAFGGVFSHRSMHDDKGARLFFGLATLLVPIQFTQLGAMVYEWVNPSQFQTVALSLNQLLLFAAISVLVGALSTFGGLSILARPYAGKLTVYFLLLNALLLLPERSFVPALFIGAFMAVGYYWLNLSVFIRDTRFTLVEGQAVKVMLIVPLMIVLARAGFHVSNPLGLGVMVLQIAFFMQIITLPSSFNKLSEALSAGSLFIFSLGWMIVAEELFTGYRAIFSIDHDFTTIVLTLPILVMTAKLDLQTPDSYHYRLVGSIVFALYGFLTWATSDMFALALLCIVSALVFSYAIKQQSKALLAVSVIYFIISLFRIIVLSIGHIDINAWLGFAIAGVLLVVASSVIERYGFLFKNKLTGSLSEFKSWEY